MTFVVKVLTAPCEDEKLISSIITFLKDNGYAPLIANARLQFLKTFDENAQIETVLKDLRPHSVSPVNLPLDYEVNQLVAWNALSGPKRITGDFFLSPKGHGLLYIRLITRREVVTEKIEAKVIEVLNFQIGYLGDEKDMDCLDEFASLITGRYSKGKKKKVYWTQKAGHNSK